jgi:Leucine-rich repeat (LRR) protein
LASKSRGFQILSFNIFIFLDSDNKCVGLTLSKSNVTTTESYSSGLPNPTLTTLNIESANIECLEDGLFDGSQSLTDVRMRYNKLEFFDPRLLFSLTNLQILYLSYNQIDRIPHNLLKYNNQINLLALPVNKITFLPKKLLTGHTKITTLFFGGNRINKEPDGFFNFFKNCLL